MRCQIRFSQIPFVFLQPRIPFSSRSRRGESVTLATSHRISSHLAFPWTWLAVVCWLCSHGCAALPYRYGQFSTKDDDRSTEIAFQYGKPQKSLDNIAWFTGIWSRVLTLNSKVNNHAFSDESKEKLIAYLEENDLTDVLVRVNQYDPKGEWQRLRENDRVGPGWRYSIGLLSMAHYMLVPGRVFGGDEYNPYTNTLYINSDVSAVALHEAAYAKDVHSKSLPGSYAFVNEIPPISIWRHTVGVNDVLGYAQAKEDWAVEMETYRVVYPQMGIHSTMLTGSFLPFWDGVVLSAAGAAAGHVTGRVAMFQREGQQRTKLDEYDLDNLTDPELMQANQPAKTKAASDIQVTNHEVETEEDENP